VGQTAFGMGLDAFVIMDLPWLDRHVPLSVGLTLIILAIPAFASQDLLKVAINASQLQQLVV
jgi:hypothetical protein